MLHALAFLFAFARVVLLLFNMLVECYPDVRDALDTLSNVHNIFLSVSCSPLSAARSILFHNRLDVSIVKHAACKEPYIIRINGQMGEQSHCDIYVTIIE